MQKGKSWGLRLERTTPLTSAIANIVKQATTQVFIIFIKELVNL
jgi:hypothetical protein